MIKLILSTMMLFAFFDTAPAQASLFGPSNYSECLQAHKGDLLWPMASPTVYRSCWILFANPDANGYIVGQGGTGIYVTSIQLKNRRTAASCFLDQVGSKDVLNREQAYKAAGKCSADQDAFHFLSWSFEPQSDN